MMFKNRSFFYKLPYDIVAAKMEHFIGPRSFVVNRYSSKSFSCQPAGTRYTRLIGLIGLIRSSFGRQALGVGHIAQGSKQGTTGASSSLVTDC
jgi:hypothetical protein